MALLFASSYMIAPYGHSSIQVPHPVHESSSSTTMESSLLLMAFSGQASTHGGSSQWMQLFILYMILNFPFSFLGPSGVIDIRFIPSGSACSCLHAIRHAMHPQHPSSLMISLRTVIFIFPLFRIDFAEKASDMGCTHGRVTVIV